jgi:Domain of unknown function (DUF1877)
MSMICWVLGLASAHISALRAEPSLASDLARAAQDKGRRTRLTEAMSRMPPEKREATQAQYQAMLERIPGAKEAEERNARVQARLEQASPLEEALSLEKSWHMLHYLFTGHVDPWEAPGNALLTGEELGEDFAGYGPARLHNEKAVQEFASFLKTVDLARLQARVNFREMSRIGVYGMPFGRDANADFDPMLRAEVAAFFPRLRDYVGKMAEKQNGLLIWLS